MEQIATATAIAHGATTGAHTLYNIAHEKKVRFKDKINDDDDDGTRKILCLRKFVLIFHKF